MARNIHRRVEEVVSAALALEHPRRQAFVEEQCGDDAELLEAVRAALESTGDRRKGASGLLAEGDRVGAYTILREISHDDLGNLYLASRAEDTFDMEVAVRVLGKASGSEGLGRLFAHEQRTLAALEHPNVARLLEAGTTPGGHPYWVREYFRGTPIDRYCDEHELSIEARIRLLLKVCCAVQLAHRSLVAHGGLEPGKILVSSKGEPVVLDFGIAATPPAGGSSREVPAVRKNDPFARRPLAPRYAAPEQYKNESITQATDVYSLGVLLYELLTGRGPYRNPSDSFLSLARTVSQQIPLPPSRAVAGATSAESVASARASSPRALRHRLRGDLDAILLRALAKRPERRYPTVQALATDLRRHLAGHAVEARRGERIYRARKLVREHAVALALIAAVLGGGSWILKTATERRVESAFESRDQALRVSRFLVDQHYQWDPRESSGTAVTARQLLDAARARLELDPSLSSTSRPAQNNALGGAYLGLGFFADAELLLERGLRLRRELDAPPDVVLVDNLLGLAAAQRATGRCVEAEALESEARTLVEARRIGDTDFAVSLNERAFALNQIGHHRSAEVLYRLALEIKRRQLGDRHPAVARAAHNLAATLQHRGRYEEAESLLLRALESRADAHGRDSIEAARTLNVLAALLINTPDLDRAEDHARRSLEIRRRLDDPGAPEIARALNTLATVLRLRGRTAEARDLLQQAEAGLRASETAGEGLGAVLVNLAGVEQIEGRAAEAASTARRALDVLRRSLPPSHWRVAHAENVLGGCLMDLERYAEAEPLLTRSYGILKADRGAESLYAREARERFDRLRASRADSESSQRLFEALAEAPIRPGERCR